MDYWFTADTHFGHKNVIRLCNRPFTTIEEHDERLIENWNSRVKNGDIVYHLGDFAFAGAEYYFKRLKGDIIYLWGNHDKGKNRDSITKHCQSVHDYLELRQFHVPIVLCHYAFRVWNKSHHGAYMFYGHSHGTLPGNSQSLDVGVDWWDFSPTSLGEIEQRLKTLPPYGPVDHHNERTNP